MHDEIKQKSNKLLPKLISHRRFLHENPETAFDTDKTSQYIYSALCTIGVECSFICKNTVVANIYGKGTKTVLLRADIDALPTKEETGLDFASKNDNMHSCGHDMHTSMLLGAAEILYSIRDKLCGNVRILFQPAEEILLGAKSAVDSGVLDGVDCAITLHVMTDTDIPTGSVLLSYDTPSAPSADFFEIKIFGKGCHGSSPSIGIDPITCACRVITALEHIRAYELGIHDKAVLTIGQISGGNSANAIPDEVLIKGTLRCFDEKVRTLYKKRFEKITESICSAFGCDVEILYTSGCPTLINDRVLLDKVSEKLTELLGEDKVVKIKDSKSKIQGSEDFAYISQKVPSVSVAVAAGSRKEGFVYPLHNPKVIFDENALTVGCEVFVCGALSLLGM